MSARSALSVRRARALGLASALACAAISCPAWAEPSDTGKAAAQALFDEARALTAEQRWADACPKLAESQRLDPSLGTQFYLAECLEHTGRIATAWTHYLEVADAAQALGQEERGRYARAHAEALRPRLARLTVNVAGETARAEGLAVTRDEATLGAAQWTTAIPVDPGEHVITASARGKKRWTTTVSVGEGEAVEVAVPALEEDRASAAAPAAPPPSAAPPSRSALRVAGFITGAVGIAGAGVGVGFGVVALHKKDESNSGGHCDAADTCDPIGKALRRDSLHAATTSTIALLAGGAAIAVGTVLLLAAPPRPDGAPASGATLALELGPGSFALKGRW